MQNFRFIGAMVSEFRFFKKKMKKMNMAKLRKSVFRISCDIFSQFFCIQLLFYMLSTLMSQIEIETESENCVCCTVSVPYTRTLRTTFEHKYIQCTVYHNCIVGEKRTIEGASRH